MRKKNYCFVDLDSNVFYLEYAADADAASSQAGSVTNTNEVELNVVENDLMMRGCCFFLSLLVH